VNRTFALPKPPFPRTAGIRPQIAHPVTELAPVASVAAQPADLRPAPSAPAILAAAMPAGTAPALREWSVNWGTGWAAGSWVVPSSGEPTDATAPNYAAALNNDAALDATAAAALAATGAGDRLQRSTPAEVQSPITVHAINEPTPGPRWRALFGATWPAYRAWYLSEGDDARPDLVTALAMLAKHMPELLPTYRRLVDLVDGDEVAARMLTMWNAPAFLPACSQAALTGPTPALCRNYDYSPELWEQTIYTSAFTGRRVIGTGDCLWGLLDGMNDAGLAVSLTFGGRPGSGSGFAIPLVVRYLLEVAGTAGEARELLRGLPIAMSYNLTVVDAAGGAFTAFVAPGQEPEFSAATVATNHHGLIPEFPERANSLRSVPRLARLQELLATGPTTDELAAAFGTAPLHNDEYSRAFGTLYTALYLPAQQVVEYRWPDVTWRRGFDDTDDTRTVVLSGV
jgi:predicted choloylglycine hydrolase